MRASLDGLVSAEGSCGFVAEKRFPKVPKTKAEKQKTLKKTLNITYYIKSYSHKIIVSNWASRWRKSLWPREQLLSRLFAARFLSFQFPFRILALPINSSPLALQF